MYDNVSVKVLFIVVSSDCPLCCASKTMGFLWAQLYLITQPMKSSGDVTL